MTATDEPLADQAPPDSRRRSDPAELPALSIDGVSHSYGARRALKDIGFTIAPASFTALLGLNGAAEILSNR
jgi:ABC-2 type transport system ATP-binding protein